MNTMKYQEMVKIKLWKNGKLPVNSWTEARNQSKDINSSFFNIGIITGQANNLLVVDIDAKDDGVGEFNKYLEEFGEIDTITIKTPRGGYHYYFQYYNDDPDTDYLI